MLLVVCYTVLRASMCFLVMYLSGLSVQFLLLVARDSCHPRLHPNLRVVDMAGMEDPSSKVRRMKKSPLRSDMRKLYASEVLLWMVFLVLSLVIAKVFATAMFPDSRFYPYYVVNASPSMALASLCLQGGPCDNHILQDSTISSFDPYGCAQSGLAV